MKNTKGQNGITLIALVVTIIVLLILAGVTITYVLSDGGIFDAAGDASKKTTSSSIKEYAEFMQSEVLTAYYAKEYAGSTINGTAADLLKENGVTDDNVGKYFPDNYVVSKVTDSTALTLDKGKFKGDFVVTTGEGKAYTVSFTDGVCSVTDPS